MSVLDFVQLGAALSVRRGVRCGDTVYIHSTLKFTDTTYLQTVGGNIETTVGGSRAMSLTSTGGTLHGTWTADTVVAVSDRRLKANILPLVRTLQQNYHSRRTAEPAAAASSAPADSGTTLALAASTANPPGGPGVRTKTFALEQKRKTDAKNPDQTTQGEGQVGKDDQPAVALGWVLRQLRPVSYNFRRGSDAKHVRFGFIADEMEAVLPQLVRTLPEDPGRGGGSGTATRAAKAPSAASAAQAAQAASAAGGDELAEGSEGFPGRKKGIVYDDLIAFLAAMMREFSVQLDDTRTRLATAEMELDRLDAIDPMDAVDPIIPMDILPS